MTVVRNIGKNTLGDNNKMSVAMRDYEMSNHDLSFVFRNTQSPGTLVPFMKIPAQKGDVWDFKLISKALTHPTVGPLFGSYKLQHFVFSCPIRLYNSWLHNNRNGIGMKMSDIKLPVFQWNFTIDSGKEIKSSSSSLLNYLGFKGLRNEAGATKKASINALPALMYGDIFKCFFSNKQEKDFYYIGTSNYARKYVLNRGTDVTYTFGTRTRTTITKTTSIRVNSRAASNWYDFWSNISLVLSTRTVTVTEISSDVSSDTAVFDKLKDTEILQVAFNNNDGSAVTLKSGKLDDFDTIRDNILQSPGNQIFNVAASTNPGWFTDVLTTCTQPQAGLIVKTYDSDVFQNWVNTEWIEGSNGINEISAVDVSDGKLTMDSLNLAQKVYNMLNRIAVSGGTYRDWLETVYTAGDYMERPETPVFEGGMTQFIEFDEVVSQSATEDEPLGTLAGRGHNTNQQGSGEIHFKVSEPSYIIGIVAITPMIDYSQGNDWDIMSIKTLDDFHKPALDGIGYEDSLNNYRAWWTARLLDDNVWKDTAAGKTVAWINYMTNFNKTFGNFASGESESFMCLNRNYERNETDNTIEDLTTYIDPSKHNEIFADTNIDAMNFWIQTAVRAQVRRNISAKQIPNL